MSELKSHQEMIDSIRKLIIEIECVEEEATLMHAATLHLSIAASALMYIDGKLSASKFIDVLELAHVADLAATELFLKDAAQTEEQA